MMLSSVRRTGVAVLAVVAAGMLLTACLKNNGNNTPPTPVAGLMGFNLAPDQPAVALALSGSVLTQSPLTYTSYTGAYQNIYTGSRAVEAYNAQSGGSLLASTDVSFEQGKYYSVFLVGFSNHYRNVVSTDNFDSLATTAGNAYIRYINAIADSVAAPAVTISAGGSSVLSENAPFASVSAFKAVAPGSVSIAVKNAATAIDTSRSITVEKNKVYTVLLTGVPAATTDAQRVQIRFVENGTLTAAAGN
jgi:hypothetical protein